MSYRHQRVAAFAVAVVLGGLAVVQAGDPADFGLTPVAGRWLAVLASMLGIAAGFLPSVRGMGSDPKFLANRVAELPEHEQQAVVSTVQQSGTRERINKVRTAGKASRAPVEPSPPLETR